MATERVEIIVSSKGAVTVKKDIEGIGRQSKSSASSVDLLRNALGGLAAYLSVGALIKYADTFTNIQNRLKVVTTSTEQLTSVTGDLYDIAQKTYSSFEATATIYARTATATKALGYSSQQALKFTEQLSKATALSGVSAESASAALVQLSQGLASGTLRGEELNSLLEQLPYAASTLAKGLGVTVGQLRELGQAGSLTPKMIIDAFNKMTTSIDADFAKLTPTVSMGLKTIENGMIRLMGLLESNTGVFGMLASALVFVGNNMEYVAIAAAPLALGLAVLAARTVFLAGASGLMSLLAGLKLVVPAIVAARNAVIAFNIAILANPVTILVAAVAAVVVGLALFGKRVLEIMGLWEGFKKAAVDAINEVLEYLNKFLEWVTGSEWKLKITDDGAAAAITKAGETVNKNWMDTFKNGGVYANDKIKEGFAYGGGKLKGTIDESMTTGAIKIKGGIDQGTVSFVDAVLQAFKEIGNWFAGWFDDWFSTGADKLKTATATANANATKGLEQAVAAGGAAAGNSIKKSMDESGTKTAMAVSEQGNNLARKIAGSGQTAGQAMARNISVGGSSASSSMQSGIQRGGDHAASALEKAGKLVGDRLAAAMTGVPTAKFLPGGGIVSEGFAKGGSFRVGGSGGTDSQEVKFRASPNERVTIETPAQARANAAAREGGNGTGGPAQVKNDIKSYVVLDPNAMVGAMDTRAGSQVFMEFVTVNRDELRAKLGVR